MKSKRLFLIAGYSAHNIIDASLEYMVRTFSRMGDVIFVMDSDASKQQLEKIQDCVLHATATRHGEYDFGSYKRAYMYARDARILPRYDFVYMINDSVYGPLKPIEKILSNMESSNNDAFGLVKNPHRDHPHIQSWFIGMRKNVFMSTWFDEFMNSITHQSDKGQITKLYEQGFTTLLSTNNIKWGCICTISGRGVYNNVKKLYKMGIPFIKKASFTRHNGCLGRQILYVLNHCDTDARTAILSGAQKTFGEEYINWLLTKNPFKILSRNMKYFFHKIRTEKL